MTSLYPYLFRAFYDWLIDNEANPRILVQANKPGVRVPKEYVNFDGTILISIFHLYVNNFNIGPNGISFYTKFKGREEYVVIPYHAMTDLVCSDTGLSIPINIWLASIELACRHNGEDEIDTNAVYAELYEKESDALASENKFNNKISFSVEGDDENSSDSDDYKAKAKQSDIDYSQSADPNASYSAPFTPSGQRDSSGEFIKSKNGVIFTPNSVLDENLQVTKEYGKKENTINFTEHSFTLTTGKDNSSQDILNPAGQNTNSQVNFSKLKENNDEVNDLFHTLYEQNKKNTQDDEGKDKSNKNKPNFTVLD